MFFTYHQNNSGGSFEQDPKRGIGHVVIVEARDAYDADNLAKRIGLYFDGCSSGRDCSCCGDRWSSMTDYYYKEQGDEVPTIYGQEVDFEKDKNLQYGWDIPCYVHYLDGRIVEFT